MTNENPPALLSAEERVQFRTACENSLRQLRGMVPGGTHGRYTDEAIKDEESNLRLLATLDAETARADAAEKEANKTERAMLYAQEKCLELDDANREKDKRIAQLESERPLLVETAAHLKAKYLAEYFEKMEDHATARVIREFDFAEVDLADVLAQVEAEMKEGQPP